MIPVEADGALVEDALLRVTGDLAPFEVDDPRAVARALSKFIDRALQTVTRDDIVP